jgi:thiol-disulfide isomerase/thioredoxin
MFKVIRTAGNVLFHPVAFFDALSDEYSIGEAIIFYFVLFIAMPLSAMLLAVGAITVFLKTVNFSTLPLILLSCAAYAVISIIGAFIVTAVMHIFVLIFRGKGGYKGTFSVFAYSSGATFIYQTLLAVVLLSITLLRSWVSFLPVVIIAVIGILWLIAIPIIGYKILHKMGTIRATITFLFPCILFVLLGLFINRSEIPRIKNMAKLFKPVKSGINFTIPKIKAAIPSVQGKINWQYGLLEALSKAERDGGVVMADFYTNWCGWCKKLDDETYEDKNVVALSAQFICVKVDGDNDRNSVGKYGINGYPTIIFFDRNGKEEDRVVGYINAPELADKMKNILQKNSISIANVIPLLEEKMKMGVADKGFRLGGIAYDKKGNSAIINDQLLRIGDTVDGAKVAEISKDKVRLIDKDGKDTILKP